MDRKSSFRINKPQVIHEFFEDEAVIINLETGSYFSADKTASDIWNLIECGVTINEIVTTLSALYQDSREKIEDAVVLFITELVKETLIVPLEDGSSTPTTGKQVSAITGEVKSDFKAPVLEKYTDLQELLLLDPIHDVDVQGWPVLKSRSLSEI